MMTRAIMWFRRDLRLADNPALLKALGEHTDVVPVFCRRSEFVEEFWGTSRGIYVRRLKRS